VIPNKFNKDDLITIEYSKGNENSTQVVKVKSYQSTKAKLERLGYSVKIIKV
jgi:hypothetical protein